MEAPDTISTTSSSSKTSSNEAGARSDSTGSNSNNATTAVRDSKKPLDHDMFHSLLQRLKEPATTTPSSPSSNSNSNSAGDLEQVAGLPLGGSRTSMEAATDSSVVPVWSQKPVVNVLAILLILKDLEESRQEQPHPPQQQQQQDNHKTETSNLVHTLLARLEELGGDNADELARNLMGKDLGKFVSQMVSLANRNTNKPSEATATTASESVSKEQWSSSKSDSNTSSSNSNSSSSNSDAKPPAKKKRSHEEASSHEADSITTQDKAEFPVPSVPPPKAASLGSAPTSSKSEEATKDQDMMEKKKPTRQELLEALQQHLDILHQRGQVSSVIPVFLRSARHEEGEKQSQDENDQDDAQSTSSTLAVRKAKRRKKSPTKDQYYEDLAAEVLAAHTPGPVPEMISFAVPVAATTPRLPSLEETGEVLTESEDSISLCSSSGGGSSPNSSDFESCTADTKTTDSDAVQGRTVTFAKDTVVEKEKKCSTAA